MENFDRRKFKELVLYVADQSGGDPTFGAIKLNKILFFSDFLSYAHRGRSITGAAYQKLPYGPAPKAMLPIQEEMLESGDADLVPADYFGRDQKRLAARREPNLNLFEDEEIALVDKVMNALIFETATSVSDLSHQWAGWQLAEVKEDLPYFTVFLLPPELPAAVQATGVELARKLGLAA
jgi:hypothetical protein